MRYSRFIEQMDVNVRQRVRVKHVLDFMRTALGVPEGELFLLLVLVDGGNHAEGAWEDNGKPNQVRLTTASFALCLALGVQARQLAQAFCMSTCDEACPVTIATYNDWSVA